MARITEKDLSYAIEALNDRSEKRYRLDYAYGGVRLVVEIGDTTAIRDVSYRVSRPQLYNIIWGILSYLREERRET